jgi:alpha-L-rhamnosidase
LAVSRTVAIIVSLVSICDATAMTKKGLKADDWHAQWIGFDGVEQTNLLENAYSGFEGVYTSISWIWFPEGEPEKSAKPGTYYFRREIVIPDSKPAVKEVHFEFAGESECRAWLNGVELGSKKGVHQVKDVDVTYHLIRGTNVLCLMGVNSGAKPKQAGVLAYMEVEFIRGDAYMYWTDENWKVSEKAPDGWTGPKFDDSKWVNAKALGKVGMEPWGSLRVPETRRQPARYLRKNFVVDKKLKKATVSFCGLGWSELSLNGKKVGEDVLSPAISDYSKKVFFQTYDVKKQLQEGTNTFGVILGNGTYYAPRSEVITGKFNAGWPKMRLHLRLEYSDGTLSEVVSDESWLLTIQGPIRVNNVYDGEEYDANFDLGDWAKPGYNAARFDVAGGRGPWQSAKLVSAPSGELVSWKSKPLQISKTCKPVSISEPNPGTYILDMGTNVTGWCQLKVQGPALTQISLRHATKLKPDGTLDLTDSNGVKATDIYVLRGQGEEIWEPRFTCHKFRYVEVAGYPGKPTKDSITARVLSNSPDGL